jgi:energy-coupling factor transport system ATP-binding protein
MPPAVELIDLWWRYPSYGGEGHQYALRGINLRVDEGEFLAIVGPSGAGKSTLCYAMAGVIPHMFSPPYGEEPEHFRGEVRIEGETLTKLEMVEDPSGARRPAFTGRKYAAPTAGLLLQDPENQFLRMDLLHEVAFGAELLGLPEDEIERRVREAMEIVGLGSLFPIAHLVHPSELSGGQKQRAAIASFLAMRPRILILDEPTSDLDPMGKLEVMGAIDRLRREHDLTIILVEHNPEVIMRHADRVAVMDNGEVVAVGGVEEIYSDPDLLRGHGLYPSDVSRIGQEAGLRYGGRIPISVEEGLEALRRERPDFSRVEPDGEPARGEPVIEVEGVHYWYEDGTYALRGVDFRIHDGEFVGLIGQNGSGKTTISKLIAGVYGRFKGRGDIRVMGASLRDRRVAERVPLHVGYVFQNPDHQIFMRRVYDEVAYGLRNLRLPSGEVDARVREALERVGLSHKVDEDPVFLSRGERRRLTVASIIAMRPRVLIVDEPTTGQDFRMTEDIMSLLSQLNREGSTVIVITHDMSMVAEHLRRVIVMHFGVVVYDGPTRGFFSDEGLLRSLSMSPPMAVKLSHAYRRSVDPSAPVLISVREWVAALKGGARASPGRPGAAARGPAGGRRGYGASPDRSGYTFTFSPCPASTSANSSMASRGARSTSGSLGALYTVYRWTSSGPTRERASAMALASSIP